MIKNNRKALNHFLMNIVFFLLSVDQFPKHVPKYAVFAEGSSNDVQKVS